MIRVRDAQQREAIEHAMASIPTPVRERLDVVHFFSGVDPLWAGVHDFPKTLDGRSFRTTACFLYPGHANDGHPTVVLPIFEPPIVVVHELGHALDWMLGWRHDAAPVSWYARSNRREAFAEAFCAALFQYEDQDTYMRDEATREMFRTVGVVA